ncbi:agamous-like MADS-box protein AGL86 [Arabidopsis lyrata subsp. lyrata]|uniref:agamous-like MADS-box protein AGL86 n=1 Tax=Arabidopsis lyrata subsp. lyrata TaxID=81972 RepID=UPI000A29C74D|nr:agamous-like MADS-box protein AGL86 [Arabidopsis lyrata subsp. lyrata]|eukprot:XP_020869435.1 agamous-like MADS-box protein AGL86 [Arabidopsis lyrata subsp. lyrata]
MKSKLKLSFIADNNFRRATFRKRKGGIMKKLHDLTTLCDVKACAIIYSPYENPAVWPSTEGVQEVVSKFMEMSVTEQSKLMMNHETYLQDRITKEKKKLESLRLENRESQLTQFMFDCVKGKMSEYQYDARDLHDLSSHIDQYINQLNARIELFTENGESSSSFPPPLAVSDLPVVTDQAAVQPYIPTVFSDDIQYQNLNLNQNQQEPAQYQAPIDMILDPNQYPFQHDPFMNMLIEYPHQQVGSYVGDHAHIPFMDENYNYHQLPTVGLTTTGHMPVTTTTTTTTVTTTDVSAPYINNHLYSEDGDF